MDITLPFNPLCTLQYCKLKLKSSFLRPLQSLPQNNFVADYTQLTLIFLGAEKQKGFLEFALNLFYRYCISDANNVKRK